jgi:hypothetical protein
VVDSSLLHDRVCGVSGLDFAVDGEVAVCDGAVPNFVVALP